MTLRLTLLLWLCVAGSSVFAQILTVQQAREEGVGAFVTVRGVVTAGAELGDIRYFQDGTAGMAAFGGNNGPAGFDDLGPGDSIQISGQLKLYNGLLEISPVTNYSLLATGVPLPAPQVWTGQTLDASIESQLITVPCAQVQGSGSFSSGTYPIATASGAAFPIYVRGGHPLVGTPVPDDAQRLTGIVSVFNGYQLLPRGTADLEPTACFNLTGSPRITDITAEGFTISWATDAPASTTLRYGLTPALTESITLTGNASFEHSVSLTGLDDATFYYVQAESSTSGGTALSPVQLHMTASLSSHTIETYFNFEVDEELSNGAVPDGTTYQEAEARLLGLINDAQQTVDIAAYNMTRSAVMVALKNAHNRGVRVRYIREADTGNQALGTPAFPVLVGGIGEPLMHNKFLVVDAALVNDSYVLMGSMNFTNANIVESPNNFLVIQDQSLALTYEREFEEMWGSTGAQYDESAARFGSDKLDNTPHYFNVGGVPIESWFSPSDGTNAAIKAALRTADHEIDVALLLLTRFDLSDALLEAHQAGIFVRGLYENETDEADDLQSAGVNFYQDNTTRQLHHKYAVIDGRHPESDPVVVTGSHNWTNKAETTNDENTLIVYDADIANLFVQEFQARWRTTVAVSDRAAIGTLAISPNPSSGALRVSLPEGVTSGVLEVLDVQGRRLQIFPLVGARTDLDLPGLTTGTYVLRVRSARGVATGRLSVIR